MEKIGLKDFEVYVDAIISVNVVSGGKTMEPWQVPPCSLWVWCVVYGVVGQVGFTG